MSGRRRIGKELLRCIKNSGADCGGFIFMDTLIMAPAVCSLIITIMLIAGAYIESFSNYLDIWIMQTETRKIMEDIAAEIEYADEIYYKPGALNNRELRIGTSRRAGLSSGGKTGRTYFSYQNEGPVLYRKDLAKLNDYVYTVTSRQPLNGENYFSTNRVSFECVKIDGSLYQIEVEGYSYKTKKYFRLNTSVINRSGFIENKS